MYDKLSGCALRDDNETMAEHADRVSELHRQFDSTVASITEGAREFALDNGEINEDQLVGQILMDYLGDWIEDEMLTVETKQRLVRMAAHMGPDWTQALYHAAVFMTKVA